MLTVNHQMNQQQAPRKDALHLVLMNASNTFLLKAFLFQQVQDYL